VILRYFLTWAIPDSYDFTRQLLGILIFWGIAVASYRGDHICVDLLWTAAPAWARRAMDVFAALVTLVAMATFTWMFTIKVIGTRADNVGTFDLRQPVWIYYLIAWIGLASAVLLLVVRTGRLVLSPEKLTTARDPQMIE
jgi:TRAP-type C4-dicarboxylate transport system permease small subunit